LDDLLTSAAQMDARLRHASPLVVIGMHRSGTRLLVDILDRLGVFMGADRQGDSESVVFMLINEDILHQCGAFWSEPMSAHFVLAQPSVVEQIAATARDALAAQLETYGGPWRRHLEAGATELPAFGWKDPRNTFTLPVWKHVFPSLRTIHIVRHGVDVAASLARRHAAALRAATGESVPSALTVIRDDALGVLSSRRGWTLAEALTMWEQYVDKARQESAALGERALEVRFEDLLLQPGRVIPAVAEFCRVPAPARHEALLDGLEPGRAFAFRRDPELVAFAGSMREVLARYGYAT
jgi:Sulfotransferase family